MRYAVEMGLGVIKIGSGIEKLIGGRRRYTDSKVIS
jgi:hypothetical protein